MEQILSFTGRTSSWRTEITERVVDVSMVRENLVRNCRFGKNQLTGKFCRIYQLKKHEKFGWHMIHKLLTATSEINKCIAELYRLYQLNNHLTCTSEGKAILTACVHIEAKVGPIACEKGTSFIYYLFH